MNLNKIIKHYIKPHIILLIIIFIASLIFLNYYIPYGSSIRRIIFFNNNFKLIEGNTLKDKGKNESGAKEESEAQYTITNEVLPPADHETETTSF